MIGIKFKIPNSYNKFLYEIFRKIDFTDCIWNIDEEECIDINGNIFFKKELYSNEEFKKLIETNEAYLIFLN